MKGKTHRGRTAGVLALLLALAVLWAGAGRLRVSETADADALTITALAVGKADALIVQEGGHALLIDTGEEDDGDEIVQELKEKGIRRLDLLIVTHFDKDHVGGAAYVMEQMEVSAVLMPDYEGDRPEYREFLERLEGHTNAQRVTGTLELSKGAMEIAVYAAEDPQGLQAGKEEYDNDMSLVTSIRYGDRRFLLTGDIEGDRIWQMLAGDTDWKHDWIKMPHHGRYDEALAALLEAVSPQAAVICCSEKHPADKKTRKMLEERGISVWDTAEQAVVTVSDGKNMTLLSGSGGNDERD